MPLANAPILKMTNYKIVPENGGGVCLIGHVEGAERQTTTLKFFRDKTVKTKAGTVYELEDPVPGMWGLQLQAARPHIYEKISHLI